MIVLKDSASRKKLVDGGVLVDELDVVDVDLAGEDGKRHGSAKGVEGGLSLGLLELGPSLATSSSGGGCGWVGERGAGYGRGGIRGQLFRFLLETTTAINEIRLAKLLLHPEILESAQEREILPQLMVASQKDKAHSDGGDVPTEVKIA